jgi:guanosine-3',5'-bis(diphosphate) 3'-pyrophosphohydrolase
MPESCPAAQQDVGLLLKALKFAAEKHRHQRRKDKEQSPYINHPIEVAERIWNVGKHEDINVICAALLHDTVEDTDATFEEIEENFGHAIVDMVKEVTDDKSLPKATRKQLQIDHAPHLSQGAKHIKLADKTCNIKDIHRSAPPDWSVERRSEYLRWTEQVVSTISGTNAALEVEYYHMLDEAKKSLEP